SDDEITPAPPVIQIPLLPGSDFQPMKWGASGDPCVPGPAHGWFGTANDRANANCRAIIGAKILSFRYTAFVNALSTGRPGWGFVPGSDFVVALGNQSEQTTKNACGWGAYSWDLRECYGEYQAAVFMHELGHSLGLDHGGTDDVNNKPNYLSIMNYSYAYR